MGEQGAACALPSKREYRNMFAEIGILEEDIDNRLELIRDEFFYGDDSSRVYYETSDGMAYLEDTGNHDARTEGMSYGMMMCVQLDMHEQFDRIWRWAKTYMWMGDGENEGYFAWSCALDGTKNAYGPAPDGEEYFAMALFMAAHRWGSGTGIYDYESEARAILRAALHKGEGGRSGAPMWNRNNHQILFVPGCPYTDPSYHLPHFYELFALWADEEDREFWKLAAQASRELLASACDPVTGMSAEYSEFDGRPLRVEGHWPGTEHCDFYSDAYRTAANIGLDAEWFGMDNDIGQMGAPLRLMKFLRTELEAARCVYATDGTPLDRTVLHPLGLLATVAQGALSVPPDSPDIEIAQHWVFRLWNQPLRLGERRYYDNCLYVFAFLALSGRYRIY